MEDLKEDIKTVIAKNYNDDSVADFFQKYTFFTIFEILHNEADELNEEFLNRFMNFMATIFRYEKYAELFLFENSTAILAYILQHKAVEIRQLVVLAIRNHVPKITTILEQSDETTFSEYIGALFIQLNDENSEVGLKALDIIRRIARESQKYNYSIVKKPLFVEALEKGLTNTNSVVMMRYVDLLIEVTNVAEELFEFFKERGLMKLLIETYKTDDILLKLTIVESIPKMGDSLWNSKFINENLVQNEMIEECFDENADFYVRKNVASLVTKLIARGLIPMNHKLKASFAQLCKSWLSSGFKEELYGVLDVISNLVQRQSGVEVIFSNEQVLLTFFSLSLKTDNPTKTKFLYAYSQIFSEEMDTKLSAYMKKAFAIMGSIEELLQQKKNVQELPTNSFDKPFKWLLKVLNVPFVDIETEGLVILRNILRFDWSIMDFAKQENAVSYLTEQVAKSKEVFDAKREICRGLIKKIDEMQTKDIFLLEFKNKLIAGKNLKGPSNQMSIQTDVL